MAKKNLPYNEAQAYELKVHIENSSKLYKSRKIPIYKNLNKKKDNKTYTSDKAEKSFYNLANDGAKDYSKTYANGEKGIFTKGDKQEVAREMEKQYSSEYKLGNTRFK